MCVSLSLCLSLPPGFSSWIYWYIWWCPTYPLGSVHFSSWFCVYAPQTQGFHLLHLYICWFLILSSACSHLVLIPSKLISTVVLFSSSISIVLLFIIYTFLVIFSICSYIILLDFSSFLSTFKTTDFKYLSSKLTIWALPGTILTNFFFLWMGHIFFPLHSSSFFVVVENWTFLVL